MPVDTLIDTNPGQIRMIGTRIVRRRARITACCRSRRHRQVEQRRRDQDRIQGRHRSAEPDTSRGSDSAVRSRRIFPARTPGIVWRPDKWTESALASVSMGYQVGVTPLQMAAAVSSVANGGEYVEPRVVRAVYRDNRRFADAAEGRPPHHQRRHGGDADGDHGRRRRTRNGEAGAAFPATRSRARPARPHKLVNGRYSKTRLQRIVRRLHPVAQSGSHDHRRHRLAARAARLLRRQRVGADLQAHRRGDAALSRHRADDQSGAAGARGAPRRTAVAVVGTPRRRAGSSALVADGPPATMPGSARPERARSAAQAGASSGITARMSGDGFVVVAGSRRRDAARRRRRRAAWRSSAHRRGVGRGAQP